MPLVDVKFRKDKLPYVLQCLLAMVSGMLLLTAARRRIPTGNSPDWWLACKSLIARACAPSARRARSGRTPSLFESLVTGALRQGFQSPMTDGECRPRSF